jgi:hypothetical protein
MTANQSPGRAPSDAELIRYLDGETNAQERGRIDTALAADASLAERLAILRRRGERLSALLADADPDRAVMDSANPARADSRLSRIRPAWLRAAMIVALLGASLLVPPVRAWIIDRIEAVAGFDDPAAESSPDTPPDAGAPLAYDITVTGSTLEIEIDALQADGELIVHASDAGGARLEPVGAGAGDPILLSTDRVRIENSAGSTTSYRLGVPSSVTTLRVRMADRPVRVIRVEEPEIRIPLTGTDA